MNPIDRIEAEQLRKDVPPFKPGDTVRVHVRVVEGDKERIQVFEGTVIRRSGGGSREMFTVRKTSYGVGVERTFPVHSPRVDRLEVVARGAVRRATLYYLRERMGRAARVTEEASKGWRAARASPCSCGGVGPLARPAGAAVVGGLLLNAEALRIDVAEAPSAGADRDPARL